jgi:urease gamma subunit
MNKLTDAEAERLAACIRTIVADVRADGGILSTVEALRRIRAECPAGCRSDREITDLVVEAAAAELVPVLIGADWTTASGAPPRSA